MSKCKSCGSEIIWIKMKSGKSMPCNPRGIHYRKQVHGDKGCMLTLVTSDGNVVVGQVCDEDESELFGYVSHFATCPNADRHRKR
jgi:hypothetical protein